MGLDRAAAVLYPAAHARSKAGTPLKTAHLSPSVGVRVLTLWIGDVRTWIRHAQVSQNAWIGEGCARAGLRGAGALVGGCLGSDVRESEPLVWSGLRMA